MHRRLTIARGARATQKIEGRRALMTLRRRRRGQTGSIRTPPMRSNGSRRLPPRSATSSGKRNVRAHSCHSAITSSLPLSENSGTLRAGSRCASESATHSPASEATRCSATPRKALTGTLIAMGMPRTARRSTTRSRSSSIQRIRSSAAASIAAKRTGSASGPSRTARLDPAGMVPPNCR